MEVVYIKKNSVHYMYLVGRPLCRLGRFWRQTVMENHKLAWNTVETFCPKIPDPDYSRLVIRDWRREGWGIEHKPNFLISKLKLLGRSINRRKNKSLGRTTRSTSVCI
jgi:hypothetical protein